MTTRQARVTDAQVGRKEGKEGKERRVDDADPPAPKSRKPGKSPIPADFALSERVTAWAGEKGYDRLPEHLDAFKRKVAMAGYTYLDWDAAFMEAVREDWAMLRGGARGVAPAADASARPGGGRRAL